MKMREDFGRCRRDLAWRRADDDEELGSVGRGDDADNMEIPQAVVATVAEGETQRVGHLAAELEIFAGVARWRKRIEAGFPQVGAAGRLSGHFFLGELGNTKGSKTNGLKGVENKRRKRDEQGTGSERHGGRTGAR